MKLFKKFFFLLGILTLSIGSIAIGSASLEKGIKGDAAVGSFSCSSFTSLKGTLGESGFEYEAKQNTGRYKPYLKNGTMTLYGLGSLFQIFPSLGTNEIIRSVKLFSSKKSANDFIVYEGVYYGYAWIKEHPEWDADGTCLITIPEDQNIDSFWIETANNHDCVLYLSGIEIVTGVDTSIRRVDCNEIPNATRKTVYLADDVFEPAGWQVTATLPDGSLKDVTSEVVWGPSPLTAGMTKVFGTYYFKDHYGNGDGRKCVTIEGITVYPHYITEVFIEKLPDKTSYFVGEAFSTRGLKVTAKWNHGPNTDVTDYVDINPSHGTEFEDKDISDALPINVKYRSFPKITFYVKVSLMSIQDIHDNYPANKNYEGRTEGTITRLFYDELGEVCFTMQSGNSAIQVRHVSGLEFIPPANLLGRKIRISSYIRDLAGAPYLEAWRYTLFNPGEGEVVAPYSVDEKTFSEATLKGMGARLVNIKGLKYESGSLINESSEISDISLKLGNKSVVLNSPLLVTANTLQEETKMFFSKLGAYGSFDFNGPLGWNNGPQLLLVNFLDLSSKDITAVDTLVSALRMSSNVEGQCQTLFPEVQKIHDSFSPEQLAMFENNEPYKAAKERYYQWRNNYKTSDIGNQNVFTFSNSSRLLVISLSCGSIVVLGSLLLLLQFFKHKRQED